MHRIEKKTDILRAGLLGGLLLLLMVGPSAQAVDPLPDHIERASPEVKARYLEMINRQSQDEKLKAAEHRHQRRVEVRQQLHQHMQAEVAKRQAQINPASLTPKGNSVLANFIRMTGLILGVGFGFALILRACRRASWA